MPQESFHGIRERNISKIIHAKKRHVRLLCIIHNINFSIKEH